MKDAKGETYRTHANGINNSGCTALGDTGRAESDIQPVSRARVLIKNGSFVFGDW
jgi:hypothetical protein